MTGESSANEGPDTLLGTVLEARYRLEEKIGEGGIGRVYRARHLTLGNFVAVKVLLAEYRDRAVLRKRFEREAAALAELSHPNIVKVADFGVQDGLPYLAMELLEGDDLAALLSRGEVDPARGVAIMRQVLRALAYAHGRDVIHRDMKPHNVFVRRLGDGTDHVQVLDFGLARFLREVSAAEGPLTKTGTVLGTPAYMAPEQATGDHVDSTADVYSAGVMFYEVICGRRPFTSRDPGELLRAHLLEEPPDPAAVTPGLEISEGLRALLMRALSKSRGARFADAREMLDALDAADVTVHRSASSAGKAAGDLATANTLAAPIAAVRRPPAGPSANGASDQGSVAQTSAERPGAQPREHEPSDAQRATAHPGTAHPGTAHPGTAHPGTAHSLDREPSAGEPPANRSDAERPDDGRPHSGAAAADEPRSRSGVAVAAGIGLLAAVGLSVGLYQWIDDDDGAETSTVTEPAPIAPVEVEPATPPEAPPRPADPLAGPLPETLEPLHAKVQRGGRLSRREQQTLNVYGRQHPDDPRSRLILAHHFVQVRSLSWAFPLYEEALEIDPSVTGDPQMLPNLIEMVRSRALHRQAVELVAQAYGEDAMPEVERQLGERIRREERARLERLADRILSVR